MKKFKFSMQKVLEFTSHCEDKEKAVLKEMQFKHQKLLLVNEQLKKQYLDLKLEYERKCKKGIVVKEMVLIGNYMSELLKKIEKSQAEIKKHEKEIDTQISKLVAISREKTIMEKLKDKYYSDYKVKKRKGDELFIDDFVANSRFIKDSQLN